MNSLNLLAVERGLATCNLEAWSVYSKVVYQTLSIPDSEVLWCGMALGYEDTTARINSLKTEREAIDRIASFRGFPSKL